MCTYTYIYKYIWVVISKGKHCNSYGNITMDFSSIRNPTFVSSSGQKALCCFLCVSCHNMRKKQTIKLVWITVLWSVSVIHFTRQPNFFRHGSKSSILNHRPIPTAPVSGILWQYCFITMMEHQVKSPVSLRIFSGDVFLLCPWNFEVSSELGRPEFGLLYWY